MKRTEIDLARLHTFNHVLYMYMCTHKKMKWLLLYRSPLFWFHCLLISFFIFLLYSYFISFLYFDNIFSWFSFLSCILISFLYFILILYLSCILKPFSYAAFWFHFLLISFLCCILISFSSDFLSLFWFWFHIFSVSTVVWFISLQNLRFIPVFWFHFSTILWRNQVFGLLNSAANHLPWAPDNNGYTSLLNELSWRAKQFGLSCNLFIMLYQCD